MIESITSGRPFFKHHFDKVHAMEDMSWYPWNDYIEILKDVERELDPSVLKTIGKNIILKQKDSFLESGMKNLKNFFTVINDIYNSQIKDTPKHEQTQLISIEENVAVVTMSKNQPVSLIEGFFYGFASMFGQIIVSIHHNITLFEGQQCMEYKITWK